MWMSTLRFLSRLRDQAWNTWVQVIPGPDVIPSFSASFPLVIPLPLEIIKAFLFLHPVRFSRCIHVSVRSGGGGVGELLFRRVPFFSALYPLLRYGDLVVVEVGQSGVTGNSCGHGRSWWREEIRVVVGWVMRDVAVDDDTIGVGCEEAG